MNDDRTAAGTDGIELLMQDHREVVNIFVRLDDAATGGDDSELDVRRRLVDDLVTMLLLHAQAEESALYPLLRETLPDGDELVDRALAEHEEATRLLCRLASMSPDNLDFDGDLRTLMTSVREHVSTEEAELFPLLREHCDEAMLARLGRDLMSAKASAPAMPTLG